MSNLSEEEKQTIEYFSQALMFNYRELCEISKEEIRKILRIIDKQQKEIEYLKEKDKHITKETVEFVNSHYIHKDKIRGKIKKLEKHQEENRKELYNAIQTLNFRKIDIISNRISKNIIERDVIKELLEE